jgi:hypothetical protein
MDDAKRVSNALDKRIGVLPRTKVTTLFVRFGIDDVKPGCGATVPEKLNSILDGRAWRVWVSG